MNSRISSSESILTAGRAGGGDRRRGGHKEGQKGPPHAPDGRKGKSRVLSNHVEAGQGGTAQRR